MKDTTDFLVSATPLKSLNRITWNYVVVKEIMCKCAYPKEILIPYFFSGLRSFWTSKFDKNERYYWNSWLAQLLSNRLDSICQNLNNNLCRIKTIYLCIINMYMYAFMFSEYDEHLNSYLSNNWKYLKNVVVRKISLYNSVCSKL